MKPTSGPKGVGSLWYLSDYRHIFAAAWAICAIPRSLRNSGFARIRRHPATAALRSRSRRISTRAATPVYVGGPLLTAIGTRS